MDLAWFSERGLAAAAVQDPSGHTQVLPSTVL